MELSKQQKVLAIGGGVLGLGVCVLGYFLYSATIADDESLSAAERERDQALEDHNGLYTTGVFGSPVTIGAVATNTASYCLWNSNATAFVSRGDLRFPKVGDPDFKNGSDFKDEMLKVVKQLAELPGGADGRIVNPGSKEANFGFEAYLGEKGAIPSDDDVPRLSVQLDTIRAVVGIFSEAGIKQVNNVHRVEPKADEGESGNRNQGNATKKDEKTDARTALTYEFEVTTRPAGFAAMMDKLTADARFFVVQKLEFWEEADTIKARKDAADAAAKQQQEAAEAPTSRRASRRRVVAVKEQEEPAKLSRVVYDPEVDAVLRVKFELVVHDFGTGASRAAEQDSTAVEKKAEDGQATNQKNEKEGK